MIWTRGQSTHIVIVFSLVAQAVDQVQGDDCRLAPCAQPTLLYYRHHVTCGGGLVCEAGMGASGQPLRQAL
ncbi:hypothetical protein V8C86DRAFT_2505343 [Haematococcus lacustris]